MREILFRGKSLKTNKWVYGSCNLENTLASISCCAVIPKTIGQYTGLTDKNDKKIFEGDIVDVNNALLSGRFWVEYGVTGGAFIVKDKDDRRYFLGGCNCTVIGNIYDNPELIKE